jgi:hypothetical protein
MAKQTSLKNSSLLKNCRVQDMLDEEMSKHAGLAQQIGFGPVLVPDFSVPFMSLTNCAKMLSQNRFAEGGLF